MKNKVTAGAAVLSLQSRSARVRPISALSMRYFFSLFGVRSERLYFLTYQMTDGHGNPVCGRELSRYAAFS